MLAARRMMNAQANPPAFKASTTADPGGTNFVTSLTISSPTCAAGDLLILCADTRNRAPSSTPTGWTQLTSPNGQDSGGDNFWYTIYTKTATSTDAAGTTYTVTCGSADNMTLACLSYEPATIDVWAERHTTSAAAGVLSFATSTVTTTGSPRTIIEMWSVVSASSINAIGSPGPPTTTRAEVHMHASQSRDFTRQLVVDEPQLSAGTTTARTATDTNGGAWVAVAIAIG